MAAPPYIIVRYFDKKMEDRYLFGNGRDEETFPHFLSNEGRVKDRKQENNSISSDDAGRYEFVSGELEGHRFNILCGMCVEKGCAKPYLQRPRDAITINEFMNGHECEQFHTHKSVQKEDDNGNDQHHDDCPCYAESKAASVSSMITHRILIITETEYRAYEDFGEKLEFYCNIPLHNLKLFEEIENKVHEEFVNSDFFEDEIKISLSPTRAEIRAVVKQIPDELEYGIIVINLSTSLKEKYKIKRIIFKIPSRKEIIFWQMKRTRRKEYWKPVDTKINEDSRQIEVTIKDSQMVLWQGFQGINPPQSNLDKFPTHQPLNFISKISANHLLENEMHIGEEGNSYSIRTVSSDIFCEIFPLEKDKNLDNTILINIKNQGSDGKNCEFEFEPLGMGLTEPEKKLLKIEAEQDGEIGVFHVDKTLTRENTDWSYKNIIEGNSNWFKIFKLQGSGVLRIRSNSKDNETMPRIEIGKIVIEGAHKPNKITISKKEVNAELQLKIAKFLLYDIHEFQEFGDKNWEGIPINEGE